MFACRGLHDQYKESSQSLVDHFIEQLRSCAIARDWNGQCGDLHSTVDPHGYQPNVNGFACFRVKRGALLYRRGGVPRHIKGVLSSLRFDVWTVHGSSVLG